MTTTNGTSTFDSVKEYYGKVLQKSEDLKTNACCTDSNLKIPDHIKKALSLVHEEVHSKYYGCGLDIPDLVEGCRILDLGCGAGRDVYVLSKLVGENGEVVGVDMTTEQIEVAKKHIDYHTKAFGFSKPNVEFKQGYIEKLDELGLKDNYFDIIISNCVINLCPDKEAVLKQAFRVLKPGGELYFSDVYASRRVPQKLRENEVIWGECISGALYWNDFHNLAKKVGFKDPRIVNDSFITIQNKSIEALCNNIDFFSVTYRLFKLDNLESHCEDYGQAVIYKGTIPHHPHWFDLDNHHKIETGKVFPVCGNTNAMLHDTRFKEHFTYIGDQSVHYGIFGGCGTTIPYSSTRDGKTGGGGGCC